MQFKNVKIEIFVPEQHIETLRDELNKVGVGHIGNYDHCISITDVRGYWRPLLGATPYQGEIGEISEGVECKVEVNCKAEHIKEALNVIKNVHPYDEPLVNIIPLVNPHFE